MQAQKHLLSTHIILKDNIKRGSITKTKEQIRELMDKKGIDYVTIEVDFQGNNCNGLSCKK